MVREDSRDINSVGRGSSDRKKKKKKDLTHGERQNDPPRNRDSV